MFNFIVTSGRAATPIVLLDLEKIWTVNHSVEPRCLDSYIYFYFFFCTQRIVLCGCWDLVAFYLLLPLFFSQERFLEHSFSFWGCALRGKGFLKARSCVYFAAQRAGSLFSLTDPQLGGPDTRPAASPVQFQTPQTPRTTPTLSR